MRATAPRSIPRLVVAGTHSGAGKTTVTVGLAVALRRLGLRVAMFKCGPDYLDPTVHARAAGVAAHNLDGWMMGRQAVLATFARATATADVALVEGVMGLFDGASPTGDEGSTAEIARWLEAPVLLVVDVAGMARSVAALARGFATFDPTLHLAGVVCNRAGSEGHVALLRQALKDPPVLGGLRLEREHAFPERHLGLHAASEEAVPEERLAAWGDRVAAGLALERILELARAAPPLPAGGDGQPAGAVASAAVPPAPRCRLGVAHDEAFHFYYEDNLRRLEAAGAELVRFSPLRDATLPPVDGLYLGGGYPELHAARLAANDGMRAAVAAFAAAGRPIYAECGGLMYLARALRTLDGRTHPMVGVIPGEAVMAGRLRALGYVEVETQAPSILGPAGLRFRGHQFRYSELEVPGEGEGEGDAVERVYRVRRRRAGDVIAEGYRRANVLASYVHAHFASNPQIAGGLVSACATARRGAGDAASVAPVAAAASVAPEHA